MALKYSMQFNSGKRLPRLFEGSRDEHLVDTWSMHIDDLDLEIAPAEPLARVGQSPKMPRDEVSDGVVTAVA